MKKAIYNYFTPLFKDRPLLLIGLLIGILSVTYVIYVGLSLSPTELQVATHYTAFGETQYYRNKWYYLFTFIGLAVVIAATHTALMAKLLDREMRSIALMLGWFTILLMVILFIVTHSVLEIAYLS